MIVASFFSRSVLKMDQFQENALSSIILSMFLYWQDSTSVLLCFKIPFSKLQVVRTNKLARSKKRN